MSDPASLTFRRYRGPAARDVRATVEAIYRDSYTPGQQADPFNSPDTWMRRFDAYTSGSGFDLVIAYAGGEPAGQAWGWPLTAQSSWWTGLVAEPEPGFTAEDGTRTFALSEIMVRSRLAGRGVAHALHDGLLAARQEKRATLLVEPDNTTAYRAYTAWGWQRAAQLRPDWPDAPLFDVLILALPVRLPCAYQRAMPRRVLDPAGHRLAAALKGLRHRTARRCGLAGLEPSVARSVLFPRS